MADETAWDKIVGWINAARSSNNKVEPDLYNGISYPTPQEVADTRKGEIFPDIIAEKYNATDDEYLRGNRVRHADTYLMSGDEKALVPAYKVTDKDRKRAETSNNINAITTAALVSPLTSLRLHQAKLASMSNPVAEAGFDPSRVVFHTGPALNIGGSYLNRTDTVMADPNSESSITHEFTHRGIKRLADKGYERAKLVEPSDYYDEKATRVLMHGLHRGVEEESSKRRFGVIHEQIAKAISELERNKGGNYVNTDAYKLLQESLVERKKNK